MDGAIYAAVHAAWFLSFIGERAIIYSGGGRRAAARSDRGSALIIIASTFAAVFVAEAFTEAGVALLPDWSFYLGVAMMVSGVAVRLWAVSALRSFFSYTVQIKEGHRVVQNGPYRFMRHPAYTGSLLTILGIAFALQSWGAVLLMALTFGVTFGYRMSRREAPHRFAGRGLRLILEEGEAADPLRLLTRVRPRAVALRVVPRGRPTGGLGVSSPYDRRRGAGFDPNRLFLGEWPTDSFNWTREAMRPCSDTGSRRPSTCR